MTVFVEKGGMVFELTSQAQIDAFISAGWVETKAHPAPKAAQTPKEPQNKPKTTPKPTADNKVTPTRKTPTRA